MLILQDSFLPGGTNLPVANPQSSMPLANNKNQTGGGVGNSQLMDVGKIQNGRDMNMGPNMCNGNKVSLT